MCDGSWVIGFAFTLGPMLYSLYISFTEWGMLKPPVSVGIENYNRAFTDPDFYTALRVTSFFSVFSIPIVLLTALFLAILLNEATTAWLLPHRFLYAGDCGECSGPTVLWTWILNPKFGPVNGLLRLLGLPSPNWFSNPKYVLWGFVMIDRVECRRTDVDLPGSAEGIPKSLYEAAKLTVPDAGQRFWQITLPMLARPFSSTLSWPSLARFRPLTSPM